MAYIEVGKKEGATLHYGGKRIGTTGFFVEPTIFTGVDSSMSIAKEEIFGPVLVISTFQNDDDIVRMANDSDYGLAASVFSTNIKRALTVAHQFQAGTVGINLASVVHNQVPFGGVKQSGMGRELGEEALS